MDYTWSYQSNNSSTLTCQHGILWVGHIYEHVLYHDLATSSYQSYDMIADCAKFTCFKYQFQNRLTKLIEAHAREKWWYFCWATDTKVNCSRRHHTKMTLTSFDRMFDKELKFKWCRTESYLTQNTDVIQLMTIDQQKYHNFKIGPLIIYCSTITTYDGIFKNYLLRKRVEVYSTDRVRGRSLFWTSMSAI